MSSAEPRLPSPAPPAPLSSGARTEDERNTISVFRTVAPSTVFVTQTRIVVDFLGDEQEVAAGSGSGFVWDEVGHIVTSPEKTSPCSRWTSQPSFSNL
jgi:hypothetical protein